MNLTTVTVASDGRPRCAACDRYLNFGQPVMQGLHNIGSGGQQYYVCLPCDAERTRDPKFRREAEARIAAHCEAAFSAERAANEGVTHFDAMTPAQKAEVVRSMMKEGHQDHRIAALTGFGIDQVRWLLKSRPAPESQS